MQSSVFSLQWLSASVSESETSVSCWPLVVAGKRPGGRLEPMMLGTNERRCEY